jgi:hypothetical protein
MAKKQDSFVSEGHEVGFVTKVALRRYFLRAYHNDGDIRVLDCCQGFGTIWGRLRSEFKVAQYWGVDADRNRKRAGRLVLDSSRILAQSGLSQNVFDIDTYGSPWKHWLALLAHGPDAMTVFLTFGRGTLGGGWDSTMVESLGLTFAKLKVPDGIVAKITADYGVPYSLGRAAEFGYKILDCREAVPRTSFRSKRRSARYFGIRLTR